MIQRIQSLYLLATAVLSLFLFFFPFQSNIVGISEIKHIQLSIFHSLNNVLFIATVLNIVVIIDSLTIIILYKNRKLQMILTLYTVVMHLIIGILMFYGASQVEGMPVYKFSYIIPVLNIVLSLMAFKNIKRDEELVQSSNRIR